MIDITSRCRATHAVYCQCTGMDIPMTTREMFGWEKFLSRFSDDDLRLTVRFMQAEKRKGNPVRGFQFRNFISGPDSLSFFAEDLASAKAWARIPVKTPRDYALESIGRKEPVKESVRTPAQILAADRGLKQLLELRDRL